MPDGGREVAGGLAGRDQDTVDLLEEYAPMAGKEPETLIVSHDLDLHPRPEAGRRAFGMRSLPKRSSVAGFVLAMSDGNPGSPTLAMVGALPNSWPARRLGVVALAFLYGLPAEARITLRRLRYPLRGARAGHPSCGVPGPSSGKCCPHLVCCPP